MRVLNIPGIGNSGPEHWQSRWERVRGDMARIVQREWDAPDCAEWMATIDRALASESAPVVLTAHSAGCIALVKWAAASMHAAKVHGALLVAPADPEAPSFPAGTRGFAPTPRGPLPFRAIVVASENDPYLSPARAKQLASDWGAELVNAGPRGHLGSAAQLGDWPLGLELLAQLSR